MLANIYLHYAFDQWMIKERKHPAFERYADDIIVHCGNQEYAETLLEKIKKQLAKYSLQINEEKTRIVYCKTDKRKLQYETVTFTFLGFDFKPRLCVTKEGKRYLGYGAGISKEARKSIVKVIRQMKLPGLIGATIEQIASFLNARIRGWLNYYGL